jgi:hypothetical protein
MSTNRAPSIIWSLRGVGTYPNGYVRTTDDDGIHLVQVDTEDGPVQEMWLTRADARLLARRINECLDRTRK